jgi:hypothetical protein
LLFKIILLNIIIIILQLSLYNKTNKKKSIHYFFLKFIIYSLYNKIKEFLNIDVYTQFNWYLKIYLIFTFYSMYSLLPKINSVIAILAIPTYCSF